MRHSQHAGAARIIVETVDKRSPIDMRATGTSLIYNFKFSSYMQSVKGNRWN